MSNLLSSKLSIVAGTEAIWNTCDLIIPENMVIITTDTKIVKLGDSEHVYADLPVAIDIDESNTKKTLNYLLANLSTEDQGRIIYINNLKYDASSSSLNRILERLESIGEVNVVQNQDMTTNDEFIALFDYTLTTADNNKLAIVSSNKMTKGPLASSFVLEELSANPLNITLFELYTDANCTIKTDTIASDTTYYAVIDAQHDTVDKDDIVLSLTLSEEDSGITITQTDRMIFTIVVGTLSVTGQSNLIAEATHNTTSTSVYKIINKEDVGGDTEIVSSIIVNSLFINAGDYTIFTKSAFDSAGNIYSVGYTYNTNHFVIAKYDSDLNVLLLKNYTTTYGMFESSDIIIDTSNNIFVAGSSYATDDVFNTYRYGFILKLDTSLNILVNKKLSYTDVSVFITTICLDSYDNIYVAGYTYDTNTLYTYDSQGFIMKINNTLDTISGINKVIYDDYGLGSRVSSIINDGDRIVVVGTICMISSEFYESKKVGFIDVLNLALTSEGYAKIYGKLSSGYNLYENITNYPKIEINDVVKAIDGTYILIGSATFYGDTGDITYGLIINEAFNINNTLGYYYFNDTSLDNKFVFVNVDIKTDGTLVISGYYGDNISGVIIVLDILFNIITQKKIISLDTSYNYMYGVVCDGDDIVINGRIGELY